MCWGPIRTRKHTEQQSREARPIEYLAPIARLEGRGQSWCTCCFSGVCVIRTVDALGGRAVKGRIRFSWALNNPQDKAIK